MTEYDAPSYQNLLAHLARLDLRLRRAVLATRQQATAPTDDEFRGLYISDQLADTLLDHLPAAAPGAAPAGQEGPAATTPDLDGDIAAAGLTLEHAEAAAARRGDVLRLPRLCRAFGLSRFERDVIVAALAAEVDLKYERLFAYLQDDVTKKRPTVDLLLELLCESLPQR